MNSRRAWPWSLIVGILVLTAEVAIALSAGWLRAGDPQDLVGAPFLLPASDLSLPLGTDILGRDILSGLLHGARISLIVGFTATAIALLLGVTIGLIAGYFGGWVDHAFMRITELFQAIPHFLFAIILVAIMGAKLENIVFAIGVTSWPMVARLVRAETMVLRELDFVRAAIAMGAGHFRVLCVHILPNALPPVVTILSVLTAMAVLTEVGLAFLGLGDSNRISWGSMIGAGRESLREAPYICLIPGAAVVLTILSLSMIGDGLARLMNPRSTQ